MTKNPPTLIQDNRIKLVFENAALESMFLNDKQNLSNHLFEKYGIQNMIIESEVIPISDEEKGAYLVNPKEKYDYLKNKNPEIENFIRKLGLKLEE